MNSLPYDIALVPSEEIGASAINASNALRIYESLFTLQAGKFYPHVSIYQLQIKDERLPQVDKSLKNIADSSNDFKLKALKYCWSGRGYLDVEYEKTDELTKLQEKTIAEFNPIRDGLRQNDKSRLPNSTGLTKENIEKYGTRFVGNLFRPHLTLTRFPGDNPESLKVLPNFLVFSGLFLKLGLFEMGSNGTAIRKIFEYELKNG